MTDYATTDTITTVTLTATGDTGGFGLSPTQNFVTEMTAVSPITSAILGSAPPRPQTGLVFPRGKL